MLDAFLRFLSKWFLWALWRVFDSWYRRRLPGRLCKGVQEHQAHGSLLSDLPVDTFRASILPFLSTHDVVHLESLVSDKRVISVLHERLRSSAYNLNQWTALQAVSWLYARKISPRKLIVHESITQGGYLCRISAIVGETRSFVLRSDASLPASALTCLIWRFGKHLRELDLRHFDMTNQVLGEIKQLSSLEWLSFAIGSYCTLDQVSATLHALPGLRHLGVHNNCHKFSVMDAIMVGRHCTKLTSLALSTICLVRDETKLAGHLRRMGSPLPLEFQFRTLATFLKSIQRLYLAMDLSADSMRALARHYGHLKHLTFYHTTTLPAFTISAEEAELYAPHLRYVDMTSAESAEDTIVLTVARHCNELLELRARYYAELTDVEAGAPMQAGPVVSLQLRLYSRWMSASALQALQDRHLDVKICRDV